MSKALKGLKQKKMSVKRRKKCPLYCSFIPKNHPIFVLNINTVKMRVKAQNVFVNYLDLLGVRFTESFSNQYFNEHPHKYNLYGLSKMLSDYGVQNAGISIPDKANDITEIQTPFIAQYGGDFAVVSEVTSGNVSFVWRGLNHSSPIAKFIEAWTGVVLLAESSEKSIEPDYKEHRKAERLTLLKKASFIFVLGLITVFAYIYNSFYVNFGTSLLLTVNLIGVSVSWMLLLKQLKVQSQYADRICSLFKQKDCNNVLESEDAKLFGIIGWSEIGFSYFTVNVLLLLFSPAMMSAIALINIFTLPFTLWSLWYQRVKVNQWCVLCLLVLALLWSIFAINLLFGHIQLKDFVYQFVNSPFSICNSPFAITACCYCIAILGTNLLAPKFNSEKTIQSLKQSMNSLKADEDVLMTLLKKQPYYEMNDFDSIICFGNPDSKLRFTILSNPYCNPCAAMHKRIEELLQKAENSISIQYILSSFNENLNSTNKYLIAACLSDNTGSALQILSDWFEKGKQLKDAYFKRLSLTMDNPEIEAEFQKHEAWKDKTQIRATPTVLVNGYQLPDSYKIENLRYFTDLDL
jgi:uncharacterized membrane protein